MNRDYSKTFSVQNTLILSPNLPYRYGEGISSSENFTNSRGINASLGLSFGMDVPITKRLSINAEQALAGIYQQSFNYIMSFIHLQPTISGGLRYSFGKRPD